MMDIFWRSEFQALWQVCSLLILGGSFRIAQKKFPGTYSFFSYTMSSQGNPTVNHEGHSFWRFGAIATGVLRIVDFCYIYVKLEAQMPWIVLLGFICGIAATLGFAGVGVIPEHKYKPHMFFANVAFVGYFLAANLFLLPFFSISLFSRLPIRSQILLIGCYVCFEGSFIAMISAFFKNGGDKLQFNLHKWKGFPIWEWIYFWNIVIWTVVIAIVVRSV